MKAAFRNVTTAALLGLMLTVGAHAQTKKELVARVIELQQQDIQNAAREIAGGTAQRVLQAAAQAMGNVPQDKQKATFDEVQADIKKFHDDIVPTLTAEATKVAPTTLSPILEQFSEAELKQVVAWLSSTAAKKYAQVGPEMRAALQKKVIADTQGTIEPKLKTLQASLRKKLNVPEPPAGAGSGAQ